MFEDWQDGTPPWDWPRALAMDVGGSSPNALIFSAIDPISQSIVCYDQIYGVETNMEKLADQIRPRLKCSAGEYSFRFKVIDYENRIAAEELKRYGILFDNAVKHNKLLSVHRLIGYLHPNARRPFPQWHPRAGASGAPLIYFTSRCKDLIRELPLQRWKAGTGDSLKDEMDRGVPNHAVDCVLYQLRLLPPATDVKIVNPVAENKPTRNLISSLYWEDVKKRKEKRAEIGARRAYHASHVLPEVRWQY